MEKTKTYKKNDFDPMMGGGNEVLNGEGFYISYNPAPGNSMFGGMVEDLANIFSSEPMHRFPETALYDHKTWRILNGDFRKQYAKLAPLGLDACIKFYESKKKHRSNWSTD